MTDDTSGLDDALEKLYNAAWVEGNAYDDQLEQAGVDNETRSIKELKRCEVAKQVILQWVNDEVIGEDIVYVPGNPLTLTLAKRSRDSVDTENEYKAEQRNILKQYGWKEGK